MSDFLRGPDGISKITLRKSHFVGAKMGKNGRVEYENHIITDDGSVGNGVNQNQKGQSCKVVPKLMGPKIKGSKN